MYAVCVAWSWRVVNLYFSVIAQLDFQLVDTPARGPCGDATIYATTWLVRPSLHFTSLETTEGNTETKLRVPFSDFTLCV